MIFSSIDFLLFLIVVILLLIVAANNYFKKIILILASYFFYGYWDKRFLLLILAATILDFLVGQYLFKIKTVNHRKLLLTLSLSANLGLLGFFKYFNFFIDSANAILGPMGLGVSNLHIILPVGISFYTFQTMSYTIDVYRGKIAPVKSFVDFALFVAFFPQLVAGPIVRAKDFLPQLDREIRVRGSNLWQGGQIFSMGLIKKLLIADAVAPFVDNVFSRPQVFSSATIWLAVAAYTVQIYGDFSGYSDMAIGCAHLLGFKLPRNFDMPYLSKDITEFWRRWHISLSTWLRDYLYIPLGGSRKGQKRTYLNLIITMLLGGLWHGASWNFILWGSLHGLALAAHKLWRHKLVRPDPPEEQPAFQTRGVYQNFVESMARSTAVLPTFISVSLTLLFVMVGWVLFRVRDGGPILTIYSKMLFWDTPGSTWLHIPSLVAITLVIMGHLIGRWRNETELIFFPSPYSFKGAFVVTLVLFAIYMFAPTDVIPFIYFQF